MRSILTIIFVVTFFSSQLGAQELSGTLKQIQQTGKIRIGYRYSQPPMSFADKDGKPAGYSIDLCTHIVDELEVRIGSDIDIEYVRVKAEDRFAALSENKIDILCGSTTKTLSRCELVDFTELTFVTGTSFMALKGKKGWNNFEGKKIGVVKGTTTVAVLRDLLQQKSIKAEVVLLDTTADGLSALEKGELDVICADQVVLIGLALTTGNPDKFSILPDLFSYEPFALALRQNDAELLLNANRVISRLYRTKKILEIYEKWFGQFSEFRPAAFNALIELNAIPE